MLDNIRIILVQTYHPGNIGATARAMKTMGLSDLHLIAPRCFPDEEATRMATGASDILDRAIVHATLEDAVADCVCVIGASARLRNMPLPHFDEGDDMAKEAVARARHGKVALVFGRERFGLTNEELQHCTHQLSLPTNPEHPVLNVSQAVQLCTYELRNAARRAAPDHFPTLSQAHDSHDEPRPPRAQFDHFCAQLDDALQTAGFFNQPHAHTQEKLRNIFQRADLSQRELSMLMGMIKALSSR
ncbi:RNA methyltransferase [Zymobacter sp. IVIA_5232.4 C2]|uniref:RNA methyltransferase n=1 Tax=Zymobacter sp. IVIA_5232.4 C2 TaxID=3394855 RepID=UPI0039C498EA